MSNRTSARFGVAFAYLRDLQERERKRLLVEAVKIKGLMPLLMKRRNGQRWTREEKAELRAHLRRLSELSPYLVVGVLPGAPLTIPLLAWWLDRRRQFRKGRPGGVVSTDPSGKKLTPQ